MGLFNIGSKAHTAVVSHDYRAVSNERMRARLGTLQQAMEEHRSGKSALPEHRAQAIRHEAEMILYDLGARDEALQKIVVDLLGDTDG